MRCKIELYPVHSAAPWRRRGWLALIGGVHVLVLMGWQAPERPVAASMVPRQAITYILAPVRPIRPDQAISLLPTARPGPQPDKAARQPSVPASKDAAAVKRPADRRDSASAVQSATVMQEAAPLASPQAITQPTLPADPFAEPAAKPADDLKQRSLKSAAAIDKQLRKEAWNPRDKKIANDTTALAGAIGSAYVGNNGVLSTEEITTPDGRLMTRVRTPGGGSFCAYKESNALTGGRDPIRDGIRTLITNCPR